MELRDEIDVAATARKVDRSTLLREILRLGWAAYRQENLTKGGVAS